MSIQRQSITIARRTVVRIVLLSAILGVFAVGAFAMVRAVNQMLDENAQQVARQWADSFIVDGKVVDAVLAGQTPSAQENAFFQSISRVGSVFRYKVFDKNGQLLLVSDALGETGRGSLQDHQPEIAAKILGSVDGLTEF